VVNGSREYKDQEVQGIAQDIDGGAADDKLDGLGEFMFEKSKVVSGCVVSYAVNDGLIDRFPADLHLEQACEATQRICQCVSILFHYYLGEDRQPVCLIKGICE